MPLLFSRFRQRVSKRANRRGAPHTKGAISTVLCKIEENDDRRIADRRVMAGEVEAAGFAVHTEHGDVVTALIAAIEELAGGVEVEAARIIPACPFFPEICQRAVCSYGKN